MLRLASHGYWSHEIAAELHYSVHSIRDRTKDARRKLGARTVAHAVALALEQRLID